MKRIIIIFTLFISFSIFGQENSILWKIEKDSVVSYILGTNHIFGKAFIEKDQKIYDALKSSQLVLLENIQSKDSIINNRKAFHYTDHLSDSEKKTLSKVIDKNINADNLTIRELLLLTQNYWDRFSCLSDKEKRDKTVMDDYIKDYAIQTKKGLVGLENISETINFIEKEYLKDVDETKMIASLKFRLNEISKGTVQKNCDMDHLYSTGKYKFDFNSDVVYNIIYDRNKNWMAKILNALEQKKTAFIAVGASHLDYKTGIIALLSQNGYTVTPINL